MLNRLLLAATIILAGACASPQSPDYKRHQKTENLSVNPEQQSHIKIVILPDDQLDIRGIYNPDDDIGGAGMLYAGDAGAAGMLVQVLVHAAVSSNAQDKKLAEQQKQANKVLEPLEIVTSSMGADLLIHSNSRYSFTTEGNSSNGTTIRSQPIFFVSQDLTTFSVKNLIDLHKDAAPVNKRKTKQKAQKLAYSNVVEVIGMSLDKDIALDTYRQNDGEKLKAILADLYERSLAIAIDDVQGLYLNNAPQQNHKFKHGQHQRFERGALMKMDCETVLIRNLRGWLIAFENSEKTSCNLNTRINN